MNIYSDLITLMENGRINEYERPLKIYERSYYRDGSTSLLMIKDDGENRIIAAGTGDIFDGLAGENLEDVKICPLSHANRQVLNKYIGFTNPEAAGKKRASIGLGVVSVVRRRVTSRPFREEGCFPSWHSRVSGS